MLIFWKCSALLLNYLDLGTVPKVLLRKKPGLRFLLEVIHFYSLVARLTLIRAFKLVLNSGLAVFTALNIRIT